MEHTIKSIIKKSIMSCHKVGSLLDRSILDRDIECRWPPVFIIGAPRSGTTLLYQILFNSYRFSCFPNIANLFYMCPVTATHVGLKMFKNHNTNFVSRFGFEKGIMAPSEGGNIWNRWFPYEKREGFNYTAEGYLSREAVEAIYRTVANQERLYGGPFLAKNVKMSVRIGALSDVFPDSVFIQTKRNSFDVALSILTIRRRMNLQWWSVMPREIESLWNLSDVEQVCYQVYHIEETIRKDIASYFSGRLYLVEYERLCERPLEVLDELIRFLSNYIGTIQRKDFYIPSHFKKSKPDTEGLISSNEQKVMKSILKRLYGK